jgi:hypothetical protein
MEAQSLMDRESSEGPKVRVDIDHRSGETREEQIQPLPIRRSKVVKSCIENIPEALGA